MSNKKISVILPVYNGAKYVGNSIKSVLNQTYKNFELIIVNDCSTDNTLEVISEYAAHDNRIIVKNNEKNLKLPKTLNKGFSFASGEYFTWTSDDNLFHPSAFASLVKVLDENLDIDLVYSDFSIVDMEGNLIEEVKEKEPEEIRFRDNIGACFMYRRSLAEKVGEYNPNAFLAEDYDFFIRCYKESNGKFYHISEDLYDYGKHEANLSATRKKDISHKAYDVMMAHFDFLYSECHTQEEKNRLFYELLHLLHDPKEKFKQRLAFYSVNHAFAKEDIKRIIKSRIHSEE